MLRQRRTWPRPAEDVLVERGWLPRRDDPHRREHERLACVLDLCMASAHLAQLGRTPLPSPALHARYGKVPDVPTRGA